MIYLVWLIWLALGAALAFTAMRGIGEGKAIGRLAIPGGIFVAATALILLAGTTPSGRPMAPVLAHLIGTGGSVENAVQDAHRRSQQLQKQLDAARKEEDLARSWIELSAVPAASPSKTGAAPIAADQDVAIVSSRQQVIVLAILALLLVLDGAAIVFVNGNSPSFRFGKDVKRDEQLALLDQLAEMIWAENYRGALTCAAEIVELKLRQSELLDLFYLRSYAAAQVAAYPEPGETADYGAELRQAAIRDLQDVLAIAPKRGDALYLLALTYGFVRRDTDALDLFERARAALDEDTLPFAHNESVCLLHSGEKSLSVGNSEDAEASFDQVARRGKLGQLVLQVRINIAMNDLRNAVTRQAAPAAQAILEKAGGFAGLTVEQKATLEVIGIDLNTRSALAGNDPVRAMAEAENFLRKYLPEGLPTLGDDIVDEVFSPLLDSDLVFPRAFYRDILFMLAIARCRVNIGRRSALTENDIADIAEPLLRGLQVEPRNRDLLASIGGLYYWARRDLRAKAREWLEAAVSMGVQSRFTRLILARDHAVEADRREILDLFRSTSARFLRDPSLAVEMRRALVEELGRFQEFEPMLIALQESRPYDSEEPTIATLRGRATYLSELMASAARHNDAAREGRLGALKADYDKSLAALEGSAQAIQALERSVIAEMGHVLTMN